jgi:hypothetical protein
MTGSFNKAFHRLPLLAAGNPVPPELRPAPIVNQP